MHVLIEAVLVTLVLSNVMLLGLSRLRSTIRVLGAQGAVIGLLPLLAHTNGHGLELHTVALVVGTVAVKGIIFPMVMMRTLRAVGIKLIVEPFVGYIFSIMLGMGALALSLFLGSRLPLPAAASMPLAVPAALFTVMVGLIIIVTRTKALTQVSGYMVLENGIFVFGTAAIRDVPLVIELGVLLDVFAAVFVMGITIFHINREFDHIDTGRLSNLKD